MGRPRVDILVPPLAAVGLVVGLVLGAIHVPAMASVAAATDDVRMPRPIPASGPLPAMVDPELARRYETAAVAAASGRYKAELDRIRRGHFGTRRDAGLQEEGLRLIRELDDTGFLFAMPVVFANERNVVRRAVVDHLAFSGEDGQAALAWTAIHHDDPLWRAAAIEGLQQPPTAAALAVLQSGFESGAHAVVDRAGTLAGAIDARIAIPHLIATQYSADAVRSQGDLAWIAMGTQRSYVANLIPVVGDGSGAFRPVPGVINEGFVLRVTDAVAVVYRTEVHRVLVGMTSEATGRDTSVNGWSLVRWRDWYNREYLPIALAEVQDRLDVEDAADYAELERRRREREDDARLD